MTISLNGTTGITTPAEVVNGDETVTGNLNVTGNVTVTGLINANGGGLIKSGTTVSTATTSFTGATITTSTSLTVSAPIVGTVQIGQVIAGTNIAAGTSIIAQQNGTPGGAGVYTLSQASGGAVSGTITVVGVDFYGIPSTAKRVTVLLNQVGVAASINLQLQIGSGTIVTTGYVGAVNREVNFAGFDTGFRLTLNNSSTWVNTGQVVLNNITGNTWIATFTTAQTSAANAVSYGSGVLALSGALDRLRLISSATGSPSTAFSSGSINILYE